MSWSSDDILRTLADMRAFGDDFTLVEVKSAAGGVPQNLPETICAFANMPQGGTVLLGVSQSAGFAVTGVSAPADMIDAVTSQTRNSVIPAPQLDAYPVVVDDKTVVVVEVTALSPSEKPATYRGKAYLRQADGDYEMNPNDLRIINIDALHSSERVDYDMAPVTGTSIDDLDPELLPQYLSSVRASSRRLRDLADADILRHTAVTTSDGTVTTAGLYALGYYPQGKLPALAVTAAVQVPRDGSGVRTQNRRDFDGPLPVLLEELQQWVEQNTGTSDTYRPDGHMVRLPEFPPRAIREIIANALVHRDLGPNTLGAGARVQVRVAPEALVIKNPGGLHGLSAAELESGNFSPKAVNQRLYEMAKHLTTADGANVIEGEGGGIRETLAETRDADRHKPRFIDRGVEFKALFRRGTVFSAEDSRRLRALTSEANRLSHIQKVLLLSLADGERWTIPRMLLEFSPLTRTEADEQVDGLQRLGLVKDTPTGVVLASPTDGSPSSGDDITSLPDADSTTTPSPTTTGPTAAELRSVTKNGPTVYAAIPEGESTTFDSIANQLDTRRSNVRYALGKLIDAGFVKMVGGQGQHETSYRRT